VRKKRQVVSGGKGRIGSGKLPGPNGQALDHVVKQRQLGAERDAAIIADKAAGKSTRQIAEERGVSQMTAVRAGGEPKAHDAEMVQAAADEIEDAPDSAAGPEPPRPNAQAKQEWHRVLITMRQINDSSLPIWLLDRDAWTSNPLASKSNLRHLIRRAHGGGSPNGKEAIVGE
jgi:hypothetical protein